MALSIGVSVGSKIDIAGHTLQVKSITPPNLIVVAIDNQQEHVLSDQSRVQILPDVWAFTGIGQNGAGMTGNRIAFEAPRSIRISRVGESRGK